MPWRQLMKRLRKILLSQNNLAKALGTVSFFGATKFNYHIEINENFEKQNILVLAPHPDDDVFGLGGTIFNLAKNKSNITIAYFCDGSAGLPEERIKNKELRIKDEEFGNNIQRNQALIEIRKHEAKNAIEILGENIEQVFFGYIDGQLASGSSAARALQDLIKRVKPSIIFVPSFLDNHPDHRATNEILINALRGIDPSTALGIVIWAYEVWTPIYPNRIVDISDCVEMKKKAILEHKSQLKSRNYDKAIIALNQYRAEINNISGYAEAFFASTPEIYKKLYNKS